jgi:predicted nucleic acid-binding protein
MVSRVVSNTGPIIHLTEINLTQALNIFNEIFIPDEVANELKRNKIMIPKKISIIRLNPQGKDNSLLFANEHSLDLGESQAIALALQEKADYFLTDDLDARETAKRFNLEVHGTIGIILRAFREKVIQKEEAIKKIKSLQSISSLFITKDLIEKILHEIEIFRN